MAHGAGKLLEMDERDSGMDRLRAFAVLLHVAGSAALRLHAVIHAIAVAVDAAHAALKMHIARHLA